MKKEKEKKELEEDFELEDYDGYENIDDDKDVESETEEDIDYDDFNKPGDFEVDEYENEDEDEDDNDVSFSVEKKKKSSHIEEDIYVTHPTLMMFLKWFGYLGVIIALFLIAYHITKGNYGSLLIYVLVLIGAYFLGYFLASAIDNSISKK